MPKTKTTKPAEQLSFIEWCNMLNVSTIDKDANPLDNIRRITKLWNGYLNMKEDFVKPIAQPDAD